MTIAVVGVVPAQSRALRRAGVCDSKHIGGKDAKQRRAELAAEVRRIASVVELATVSVREIDRHVYRGLLNELERKVVRRLLRRAGARPKHRIVCDGARMFEPLTELFPRLEAVDKGESVHISVAAASIVAKDARDSAFAAIAQRYCGEFGDVRGGGYLNPATRRFLQRYQARYGRLPPETRRSWGADKIEPNLNLF